MSTTNNAMAAATDELVVPVANDNALRGNVIPMEMLMPSPMTAVPAARDDDDDDGSDGKRWLLGLLVVSVAMHFGLFETLGRHVGLAPKTRHRPPVEVTMEVAAPKPAPPPTPEPEAPRPVHKTAPHRLAVRAPAPAPRAAAAPEPPAEAETLADFSGTTLTNDGPGPGWASAVGNGEAMHGPIGRPGAKVGTRNQDGVAEPSKGTAPPVVALASLSRPPAPPDLNGALERNYPAAARRQGSPGSAVLKARITPAGRVRDMVMVSQSAPGFGDACRATLRDSVWSAPLDKDGRAVATFITYTCRFEVR